MRILIYGMLVALVSVLLADTNMGRPISARERQSVYQATHYMASKGFDADSRLAIRIANSNHLRASRFFADIAALGEARGASFGYYAYTPILSRTRIFLGKDFWGAGTVGHSSILLHELSHIRWHRERFLRGFPRHADEAQAYWRQYQTYRAIGLNPYGPDSPVFWDLMIGVKYYVLPQHPQYAQRSDIKWALSQLDEGGKPVAGVAIAFLYIGIAGVLLVGGDRLGSLMGCAVLKKCNIPPLLHLSDWVIVPIALLLPIVVILGLLTVVIAANKANPIQSLANNLEVILLAAFFLTGLLGGFLVQSRRGSVTIPR